MSAQRYSSFAKFWPYYLKEHSRPATRLLHLIGTTIGAIVLVYFIATGRWFLFPLSLIPGYTGAWLGHFVIERNKPATFQYPLWSFRGDCKMIAMMVTGRINDEVKKEFPKTQDLNPSHKEHDLERQHPHP